MEVSPALSRHIVPGTDEDIIEAYARLASEAGVRMFGFEEELVFLDIETTGFDREHDAVIEIAAVRTLGPEVLDRFETLVAPPMPIPRETIKLTGIDDALVEGAPLLGDVMPELAEFVGGGDIVAHNCSFDRGFLTRGAAAAGVNLQAEWLCSLQLARIALPRMRTHRLADLADAFGLTSASHRAMPDAEATHGLWRVALCALDVLPPGVVTTIAGLNPGTKWPVRKVFSHHAAGRPSAGTDVKELRRDRVAQTRKSELVDAADVDLEPVDADAVVSAFESGGAVCRMYDDYESRDEQTRMAAAVTSALCEGRRLAIEAGTGVGKSVAYLVPSLAFAQGNGVAVGVATKTNALMDQLVYGELPALAEVLDDEFEYVALKGYDHYLCLRKLDRILAREEGAQDETVDAAMLLAWVAQTSWADVDSFNIHWRGDLRVRLTANAEDCTRRRCRHYPGLCYLHGVRRRAASAHVVVTNHSLLFRDLVAGGGILPPIRHWIVDEAHGAEAEARDQLSAGIDHASSRSLLKRLTARHGGMLRGVRASADDAGDEGLRESILEACDDIREEATTALTVATSFFDMLKDLGEGAASDYERTELRITPELRETQAWAIAAGTGRSLVRKLSGVLESGKRLFTALEEAGIEATDDRADLAGVLSRLAEHGEGLGLTLDGGDDSYVYSATIDRRREVVGERLLAQTIDVGAVLAERFYPEVRSVVYTSATIAAGNDFSHFAHGVGLDESDPEGWDAVRLDSSYDFERQMAAYVPADLPEPRDAAYLDELESFLFDLHVAMGGSVLTLFTNRRDLDTLYLRLVDRLEAEGLRLVAQRPRESVKRVRDQFVSDVDCSLFATKSFWEGFDAKGDTLRCVAVVRLPFAHPGDPLLEELKERYPAAWWERFYLPQAVLELKQAAGRLIRSSADEGCLVLCDSRVAGPKPYARRFLQALPVDDVTVADSEEVLRAIGERFGRD